MGRSVSIVSVAERLGISASEVSRAFKAGYPMKPEKRELIKKTAAEMGYVRNEAASRLTMKPISIAFVMPDDFPEFDDEIMRGAKDAERTYFAYKLIVDYCSFDSCRDSDPVSAFDRLVSSYVEHSYDALITGVCFDGIERVIKKYSDKIKIALVNFDLADCGQLFAVINDTDSVARIAAQLLSEHSEKGKCAIFAGVHGHYTHRNIVESFQKAALENGLDIACVYHCSTEDEMKIQLEEAFGKHTDITTVYATSALSVPICEYLCRNRLDKRVRIVTSDVYERLNRYIQDGTVYATLYQNPAWQAYTALENMYCHLARGSELPRRFVARPEIVIAANLHLYK